MPVKVSVDKNNNTFMITNSNGLFAAGRKVSVEALRCACENDDDLKDLPLHEMLNHIEWCERDETE